MAYVTPPTVVANNPATAAQFNILGDDIVYLKAQRDAMSGSGVALNRATDLSTTTATWTDISWVTAPVDTGGWWTSGTNIVVPAGAVPAGSTQIVVECHVQARFVANGTGTRAIQVLLTGATVERAFYTSAISGETTVVQTLVWAVCLAADILKVQIYQTSGGALVANSMSAHFKRLWAL